MAGHVDKLANVLKDVGDGYAPVYGAKTALRALAQRLWILALDPEQKVKASDVLAIAVFMRDTIEGKPKESISISKENDITPELLAAKRLELEQALLPSPPSRVSHADTTQAGDQGQQVGEVKA